MNYIFVVILAALILWLAFNLAVRIFATNRLNTLQRLNNERWALVAATDEAQKASEGAPDDEKLREAYILATRRSSDAMKRFYDFRRRYFGDRSPI